MGFLQNKILCFVYINYINKSDISISILKIKIKIYLPVCKTHENHYIEYYLNCVLVCNTTVFRFKYFL